jgi:hypothetical protein
MAWQPFNAFIGGDDQRTPRFLNTEYTQNLYYESALPGEQPRATGSLLSTPGMQAQTYLQLPENGFILALATVSRLLPTQGVTTPTTFVVVGRTNGNGNPALYRFNNDLTSPTFIQYLPFAHRSTDLMRIIPGNQNLMVVDTSVPQVYGLWHDYTASTAGAVGPTGTLQPGPDFPAGVYSPQGGWHAPIDGDFVDGYYVYAQAGSENFFISGNQSASIFAALDFTEETDLPDSMIGLRAVGGRVWAFGRQRMVAWINTGAAGFPFTRDNSSRIDVGLVNANSLVKLENTLYWLGRTPDGAVRAFVLNGYTPMPISTPAEEQVWQNSFVEDNWAWGYQEEGHPFYVITFPTINATYCYDRKENRWHRRTHFNSGTGAQDYYPVTCHTYNPFLGGHIVGDLNGPRCYLQSRSYFTEHGTSIERRRTSPHIFGSGYRNQYRGFWLDANTQAATLRYSDDYGTTYSAARGPDILNADHAEWRRLGSSRSDRIFDVRITDDTQPVVLSGAYVDAEAGTP